MCSKLKGSMFASFFLFLLSVNTFGSPQNDLKTLALQNSLHLNPTWEALLHATNGITPIKDTSFILSTGNFSLKNELIATLDLFNSDRTSYCRFPARWRFISKSLNLKPDTEKQGHCKEYFTFKLKAPAEKISLIYASENLSQPSSMMGHVMLKISGENNSKQFVEHGVSFFTELNSFNVPKIIWDSLISGKKGYFQVSPYQDSLNYYLRDEQRNVWEYEISSSPSQKEIFHDHIWELKHANINYYFNSYNCATLSLMLLRVANPNSVKISESWLSPIDIVKSAKSSNIIKSTNVIPSSKWKIRMLSEALNKDTLKAIYKDLDQLEKLKLDMLDDRNKFLISELASSYNNFNIEINKYNFDKWENIQKNINTYRRQVKDTYQIDLSDYKSPTNTPSDSQASIGYQHFDNQDWLNIKLLPASHSIEDDNRQFFSENELKLMELSILTNQSSGKSKLESWTLYSAKSNVPWDTLTGGLSGHLAIGAHQHFNEQLQPGLAANLYGGIGYTVSISQDLSLYSLLNAGIASSSKGGYIYSAPEVGLYFYQILNMKTQLSYQQVFNQKKSGDSFHDISATHSLLGIKDWNLYLQYEKKWNSTSSHREYGIHLKHHF